MRILHVGIIVAFISIGLLSCAKETPKRDHIPIIKENLLKLQEGVKSKNLARIDSLLSPRILEKDQSSDSLIRLVYGASADFPFTQFGGAEIVYSNNKGRIDCFIMDSTQQSDRPLVLYLDRADDLWLFTGFRIGGPDDSLEDTIVSQ